MTKIGVGVGEDFPIEDRSGAAAASGETAAPEGEGAHQNPGEGPHEAGYGPCGWGRTAGESEEDWRARRDSWRRQRYEWRQQRREWRRRYREQMRMRHGPGDPLYYYWGMPRILRIVLSIAAIVLVFRIVAAAPLIILGAAVLGVLYAAHRHYGPFHDRDYAPPSAGSNGAPPAQGN